MGLYESFVLRKQNFPVDKCLEWMLRAKGVDSAIYLLFAPPEPPVTPPHIPFALSSDPVG